MLSLLMGLFLSLLMFTGCEEEPVVNLKPIIRVFSASADSCEIGDVVTIRWSVENASIVIVNKDTVPLSGTKEIVIDKNITVTCTAYPIGNMDIAPAQQQLKIVAKEPTEVLTVAITATPSEIFEGEMTTISWTSENALSIKATFGGVNGLSGSTEVGPGVTTDYTVTVYGLANKSATASVTVVVKDPVFTDEEKLLCLAPWSKIKLEFQQESGYPWVEADIWECMKDDLIKFYLTPSKIGVYDNGEVRCGSENETQEGSWSLTGSVLTLCEYNNYNIMTLTKDTLVWVYYPGSQKDANRETFIHPK